MDEVADAAKLDFTSAGSYLIALYSCQVKVAADTHHRNGAQVTGFLMIPALYLYNGVQVAWGNASWTTGSFELKVGWNTVEFLVNQWTGQASYHTWALNLYWCQTRVAGDVLRSRCFALANAAGVLSSNVSQIGNDVQSANSAEHPPSSVNALTHDRREYGQQSGSAGDELR
ncbi:hypothetical protein F3Y20_26745 [Klebsiella pneumoniae]|nr:hypothetical protein [Klebsiella pneumoniae]KAA8864868.1 hypothetical protein F3Y20_26745 [Klebsiella pneumoniae]